MTFAGDATEPTVPFITKSTFSGDYDFSNSSQAINPILTGCEYVLSASQRWVSCPAGFTQLTVNLGSGEDTVLAPEVDVPMTISAGDGNDTITGGILADVIDGDAGHDTLNGDGVFGGSTSHDELSGGPGDDSLRGRVGRDELRGGPGYDEACYLDRPANEPVTISLNGVADDGATGESDNVFSDVEELQGGAGDDFLIGADQADTLLGEGGDGNDQMRTGEQDDILRGGPGDEVWLDAGPGDDLLEGGPGSDRLFPGAGADVVFGGDGADEVSYQHNGCDQPVSVTLDDVANDGVPSALANVSADVEDILGGDGNDFLAGDADAIDEDCSGKPDPYPLLAAEITSRWSPSPRGTKLARLVVSGAPLGALVVVRCTGAGCPAKPKRVRVKRAGDVALQRLLRGRRLKPGALVEVRVLMSGRIGPVARFKIRDDRLPKRTSLCLAPGERRPRPC